MSCSACIKCEQGVGMYEKYCQECVDKYGVKQDAMWHKTNWFNDWDSERLIEFQKDLEAVNG